MNNVTVNKITINLGEHKSLELTLDEAQQLRELLNELLMPARKSTKEATPPVVADVTDMIRKFGKGIDRQPPERFPSFPPPNSPWRGPWAQPITLTVAPCGSPGTFY